MRVVKSASVRHPRDARVLRAVDHVDRRIFSGRDLHHVERRFVGVVLLLQVRDARAVERRRPRAERDAPVLRPRVGIEQHLRRAGFSFLPEDHGLLLLRLAVRPEVAILFLRRCSPLVDVEELGESLFDRIAIGERRETRARERIFFRRPGFHFRIGAVFEPAVAIVDHVAADRFGDVDGGRVGIVEALRDARRGGVVRDGRGRRRIRRRMCGFGLAAARTNQERDEKNALHGCGR